MDSKKQEILESFLVDCKIRNFSEKTILAYKSHIRYYLSLHPINSTNQDFGDFLTLIRDEKQLSPSTVENYFVSLNAFYDFLKWDRNINDNLIPAFRRRYVRNYKNTQPEERQLISYKQMKKLILYPEDLMWKTIFLMYVKTGMRRKELIDLDEKDINLREKKIYLKKHHHKRSNTILFIDDELHLFLSQWMKKRQNNHWNSKPWLFRSMQGKRIYEDLVLEITTDCAFALGFHKPNGRLDEKFGVHCFRHYFTTMMLESGCPREYVQELRGDTRTEAIDIYHHITIKKLKEVYFKYIFKFGIK